MYPRTPAPSVPGGSPSPPLLIFPELCLRESPPVSILRCLSDRCIPLPPSPHGGGGLAPPEKKVVGGSPPLPPSSNPGKPRSARAASEDLRRGCRLRQVPRFEKGGRIRPEAGGVEPPVSTHGGGGYTPPEKIPGRGVCPHTPAQCQSWPTAPCHGPVRRRIIRMLRVIRLEIREERSSSFWSRRTLRSLRIRRRDSL